MNSKDNTILTVFGMFGSQVWSDIIGAYNFFSLVESRLHHRCHQGFLSNIDVSILQIVQNLGLGRFLIKQVSMEEYQLSC